MRKIILFILLFISILSKGQVQVANLPTYTVNATSDFLLIGKAAGISGSSNKMSIANFLSTYSISVAPNAGSGITIAGTSPTFTVTNKLTTGTSGGQTVIGGTAVGDGLIYKGTTGNGTSTAAAHTFQGGNNGATQIMRMNNDGNVGIGANPDPAYALIVEKLDTNPSSVQGFLANRYINLTSSNSNQFTGGYGAIFINGSAAHSGVSTGLSGETTNDGSSSASDLRGINGNVVAASTSTVTSASGGFFQFYTGGTGEITNAYGTRVEMLQNPGTITNTYGNYIGDITTGTQTNTPYSFYASDANANNYFAGKIIYPYGTPGIGKVLTDDGTGVGNVVWSSPAAGGVTSVSGVADKITVTGTTTPTVTIASTYAGQTSIQTAGTFTTGVWNATAVTPTYGGTGISTYTIGDLIQASGTSTLSRLASVSSGSYLRSVGTGSLSVWSTLKLPNTGTANYIPHFTSTNTLGENANFQYNGTTVGIGTGANAHASASLHSNVDGGPNLFYFSSYNSSATTGAAVTIAHGRGTLASPTVTLSGDALGYINFAGQFNTTVNNVTSGARIRGDAAENFSASGSGSDLVFLTVAKTTTTPFVERMRISSEGLVTVGVMTGVAKFNILSTTEQQRTAYDASNYFSTTVGSTGTVTHNAVGAGSKFVFSDNIELTQTVSNTTLTAADKTIQIVVNGTTYYIPAKLTND